MKSELGAINMMQAKYSDNDVMTAKYNLKFDFPNFTKIEALQRLNSESWLYKNLAVI